MNRFTLSDIHDGHKNILKYGRSEFFGDLLEMREAFVDNWNSVVAPDDEVYLLGDLVMGQRAENLPTIGRMNGRKHLILGNHDYPHSSNREAHVEKWTPIYAEYFESMQEQLEVEIAGTKVLMCHFPSVEIGDHTEDVRYEAWRPVYDGVIIHGHLHCEENITGERSIHVGIDADWTEFGVQRFHPIPFSAIEELMRANNWI